MCCSIVGGGHEKCRVDAPRKNSKSKVEQVYYLYGSKRGGPSQLVATFSSEQMLLAYVRWATLETHAPQQGKFEQGSPLASYNAWASSHEPQTDEDPTLVVHNPSPSML